MLKYREIVRRSFPDTKVTIPVFLTLEGDDPSEEGQGLGYISWSHVALYKVAKEVVEQQKNRIPQDAQTFLRHYLNTLRRETMQDKELEDLCKSIYRKHKAAIDLIIRYGSTTAFVEASDDFIREHVELKQVGKYGTQVWFLPKGWADVMPEIIEGWRSPYPVTLWCYLDQRGQKAGIILEIGPLSSTERRHNLVKAFRQSGFAIRIVANRENPKYSRVYRATHALRDLDDSDEIKKAIETLWQQSKDEVTRATQIIRDFVWKE